MLELTVRLVASLAVVVGLLLLLARVAGRRFQGRAGAAVQVLHRQPLSRSASVSVITVGSRILVVGTTDQQVQLLTELDPDELTDVSLDLVEDEEAELLELTRVVTDLPREPVAGAGPGPTTARRAGAHRADAGRAGTRAGARSGGRRPAGQGSLAGSVLSPDTWRQAFAAATGGAPDRTSGTSSRRAS